MDLLSRTRKINEMLQKTAGTPVNFREMAKRCAMQLTHNALS